MLAKATNSQQLCPWLKTLETERLILRPLEERDRWLYRALYTDPKIMRHTAEPFTVEATDKMFDYAIKLKYQNAPKALVWVIQEQEAYRSIGIICLYKISPDLKGAMIGIMLIQAGQGKRYPEEAMTIVMKHGFGFGLCQILAEFMKNNLATKRFVTKLGFEFLTKEHPDENFQYILMARNRWLISDS